MKKILKKISSNFIILFFLMINISLSLKATDIDINSSCLTCFDSKLRDGKINELSILKNMFKNLKCYINEPENLKYRSISSFLSIGREFKHKFDNILCFNEDNSDDIIIQVHNYINFLNIFCRDIIIPIHTKVYISPIIQDKTYNIINEILQNVSNLIKIIDIKYSDSIRYAEGLGRSSAVDGEHYTYCLYIEPIYKQLKNLNTLLKPHRYRTIYFIKSEFAQL